MTKEDKDLQFVNDDQELSQSNIRDKHYSTLVKKIIDNNDATQIIKYIFFGVVCLVFLAVSIIGILVVLKIASKEAISYADISVAITGFGGVLSSIIVLPKIIAKHLFPENSEKVRFDFISQNQKLDLDKPEYIDSIDDGEIL